MATPWDRCGSRSHGDMPTGPNGTRTQFGWVGAAPLSSRTVVHAAEIPGSPTNRFHDSISSRLS